MVAVPLTKIGGDESPCRIKKDGIMIGLTDQDIEAEKIENLRQLKMQRAGKDNILH